MRISGGTGRGRRITVPSGSVVRPTSDKVRQALFNILGDRISGSVFLDLFAGAGAVGIEAISRGAGLVVFVDASRRSAGIIEKNLHKTGFWEKAKVVVADAEAFIKRQSGPYDIIFMDPPYAEDIGDLLERIGDSGLLKPDGLLVYERFRKRPSLEKSGTLILFREARYGDTVLSFYKFVRGQEDAS